MPTHGKGTAAEQGAAVRRHFEEQQCRRQSMPAQRDREHEPSGRYDDEQPLGVRDVTPASRRHSAARAKPSNKSRKSGAKHGRESGAKAPTPTPTRVRSTRRTDRHRAVPAPHADHDEDIAAEAAAVSARRRPRQAQGQRRGSRRDDEGRSRRRAAPAAAAAAAAAAAGRRGPRYYDEDDRSDSGSGSGSERDGDGDGGSDEDEEERAPAPAAAPRRRRRAAGGAAVLAARRRTRGSSDEESEERRPQSLSTPTEGRSSVITEEADEDEDEDDGEEEDEDKREEEEEDGRRPSRRGKAALAGAAGAAGAGTAAWVASASNGRQRRKDDSATTAGAPAPAPGRRLPPKVDPKGRVYPLTGIDNVALLMEDDGYQTACFSVYLFKTKLDYDTVLDFFERLADAYPKYRYVCELDPSAAVRKDKAARAGKPPSTRPGSLDPGRKTSYSRSLKAGSLYRPARWRLDETFDLESNIHAVRAPGRGDDEALFEMCGQVLGKHFDFRKPLWEAVLVHGLRTSEGARSALMIKIHHAFSDGQGMIQSYHSAIEAMQTGVSVGDKQREIDERGAAAGAAAKAKAGAKAAPPEKGKRGGGGGGGAGANPSTAAIGSRNVQPSLLGTVRHSWHTVRGLYFRRREAFTYPESSAKASVQTLGGKLGKNGRPSGRYYAHSDGIAMGDIKLIRQAFSTPKVNLTLNDVACAILSRALRIAAEEMARKAGGGSGAVGKVRDKRVAVFIPISKRPAGDWSLANYTSGAIAWFRFHEPGKYGFEELLQQVHREMGRIKGSHLPQWWFQAFNVFAKRRAFMLPNYPLLRSLFQSAYREYHVCTNVPGPPKPVKFGRHEAFSYHVLPPSSPGKATMAIGMISYANDFSLAVSCDAVREFGPGRRGGQLPRTICMAFQQASEELIAAARQRLGIAPGEEGDGGDGVGESDGQRGYARRKRG